MTQNYKILICLALICCFVTPVSYAQSTADKDNLTFEIESLVPMFFFKGYHFAVGAKWRNYRFRASCIDGGGYDYEPGNKQFERNLGKGCGVFFGYYLTARWHLYLFIEKQNYRVTERSSGANTKFDVIDIGPGIGYQYFLTSGLYIQPALHLYWRPAQTREIDGTSYKLRETDLSPVVRLGYRFK